MAGGMSLMESQEMVAPPADSGAEDDGKQYIQIRYVWAPYVQNDIVSAIKMPAFPVSLVIDSNPEQLHAVLDKLLSDETTVSYREYLLLKEQQSIKLDFMLNGELLRTSLRENLEQRALSKEAVIDIECIPGLLSPTPERSIPHNDWVSVVLGLDANHFVSGCYDNCIFLRDRNGNEVASVQHHKGPVKCIWGKETSKNDQEFCFGTGSHDQVIYLWRFSEKDRLTCLKALKGHERSVEALAGNLNHDRLVSGGFDGLLKVWSIDLNNLDPEPVKKKAKINSDSEKPTIPSCVPLVTLSGHKEAISGLCWTGHAEVWSSSWDHTLKAWDLELAGQKHQMSSSKAFTSIDYSAQSQLLLTGSVDAIVRTWDPRSKEGAMVKGAFRGHKGWISKVKWAPNDPYVFASASYDSLLKIWDLRSPKASLYDLSGHTDKVLALDWCDGLVLSGGADCHMNIFSF